MNDDEKYFLVHRKKGGLISKESDNENVVIDLIKDSPYFLKKDLGFYVACPTCGLALLQ